MRVLDIYKTDPDWSALVELDDPAMKMTLTFPAEPTPAEVLALAESVVAEPETVLEAEAENGTLA